MGNILYYLTPVMLIVVAIILVLGLRNMMKGGSANTSQKFMRYRILAQFAAIVVMMGALYFASK